MRFIFTAFLSSFLLLACQDRSPGSSPTQPIEADRTITINMTFDRDIDFAVTNIAVVPNNVAPWAGSLFVIDENNALHRSGIESGTFKQISTDIDDMSPFARVNMAGIILTRSLTGKIEGFVEVNDEGDYNPLPLSKAPNDIDVFCQTDRLTTSRIYAASGQKISALERISSGENYHIEAAEIEGLKIDKGRECLISAGGDDIRVLETPPQAVQAGLLPNNILSGDAVLFTTAASLDSPRLYVSHEGHITAINITGGLSSKAPSQIDGFYIIQNSLGGVLRDGGLILADNKTQRLIYISLDFIQKRLSEAAPKQDNN